MSKQIILCPGGRESQTGNAVIKRYPGVTIEKCGDRIPNVLQHFEGEGRDSYGVPIWNSHQGEIQAAQFVWDYIQKTGIKIIDLWPQRIEFWFIRRANITVVYGKIGSVVVAETQCSGFLKRQGAKFVSCDLTTLAFEKYRNGADWDGVLVAPGQGENETGYEVAEKETANPNNFTSFVRFVPAKNFILDLASTRSWLTGITMPSFGATLGDSVQSFFQQLTSQITNLNDFPRLIFVLKRTANVGLLLEGTKLYTGDLLDAEEEERGGISVYEEVGTLGDHYSNELQNLFINEFLELQNEDFILHRGVNTCLFACPPLSLYTHGYEVETVAPVIRYYISKIFERIDDGDVVCTQNQKNFFERHKESWKANRSSFIQFKVINSTN